MIPERNGSATLMEGMVRPLQLDCWYISKRYCYRSTFSWQWCQKRPKVRSSSLKWEELEYNTQSHTHVLHPSVWHTDKMQLQLGHCKADVKLQTESVEASVLWTTVWITYTFFFFKSLWTAKKLDVCECYCRF